MTSTTNTTPTNLGTVMIGCDEVTPWQFADSSVLYVLNGSPYLSHADLSGCLTAVQLAKVDAAVSAAR